MSAFGRDARAVALAMVAVSVLAACEALPGNESGDETAPPALPARPEDALSLLDPSRLATESRTLMAARAALDTGFRCGWHVAWTDAIRAGRSERPAAFRGDTMGAVFTLALVLLVAGLGGTLALAWVLPRLRRRVPRPIKPAPAETRVQSWVHYFGELVRRLLGSAAHALRVDQLDRSVMDQRIHALLACRQAERELARAAHAVERLHPASAPTPTAPPSPPGPDSAPGPEVAAAAPAVVVTDGTIAAHLPPDALRQGLLEWGAELAALRRRLAATSPLPRELAPDLLVARLDLAQRRARDLRVTLERLLATQTTPAWNALVKEVALHPETPRESVPLRALPLAPWVRPAGLAGLAALTLGLFMVAGWTAAGAFPLFFALVFSLGGLAAVVTARVHLHRAGRQPLLPGFADRVGSWLTSLAALALAVLIVSSWMSAESGLDMGDPPPVPVPDPITLTAPPLWPAPTPGTSRP